MTRTSRSLFAGPLLVAAVVAALYGLWFGYFEIHGDLRSLLHVSAMRIRLSEKTPYPVKVEPGFPLDPSFGYDGQWVYFIARDPAHARYYLDDPPYRYGRILLPALTRLVTLGKAQLMPGAIFGINFAWIVISTAALGLWLRRRGESAALALVYGLYPGLLIVLSLDLTEAMAFGLAAVGILVCDFGGHRGRLLGGLTFGLAALTRDQAILFGAAYALYELFRRDGVASRLESIRAGLPRALEIGLPALIPLVGWDLFILHWLHSVGPDTSPFERLPFYGLFYWVKSGLPALNPGDLDLLIQNLQVLLPTTVICAAACAWSVWKRHFSAEQLALVLNTTVIIWMDRGEWHDFQAGGRAALGMVLAAVTFAPATRRLFGTGRAWFFVCGGLWLSLSVTSLFLPDLVYTRFVLTGR